jgi:glycosyltransferase involved in cell wall biosynthesis
MENPVLSIITISRWNDSELDKTIVSVNNNFTGLLRDKTVEHIIVLGEAAVVNDNQAGRYYYTAPPKGIYNAMNFGLDKAKGEWTWFLNAGDECVDNIHDKLLQALSSCNAGVLKAGVYTINSNNDAHIIFGRLISPHPGTFYRTKVLQEIGGYREDFKIISDQIVFETLFLKKIKMYRTRLIVANFYENGVSISFKGISMACKERLKYALECPINILSWYIYIRTVQGYLKAKFFNIL